MPDQFERRLEQLARSICISSGKDPDARPLKSTAADPRRNWEQEARRLRPIMQAVDATAAMDTTITPGMIAAGRWALRSRLQDFPRDAINEAVVEVYRMMASVRIVELLRASMDDSRTGR